MPLSHRPHYDFDASFYEDRIDRMSALLVEQETLLRVAHEYVSNADAELNGAVADIAQQASVVAVMLRHHLARAGADVERCRRLNGEQGEALREVLHRKIKRQSRRPHLFDNLQRHRTTRLWRALAHSEDKALTKALCRLSALRRGGVSREPQTDAGGE